MTGITKEEYFAREFAEAEERWRGGEISAVKEALLMASWNRVPLPDWLSEALSECIDRASGIGPGRGKTGGFRAQEERAHMHKMRWSAAKLALASRGKATRKKAFEEAARMLARTPYAQSAEAIEESYNLVQRRKKHPA